jgi:hypothetical protein
MLDEFTHSLLEHVAPPPQARAEVSFEQPIPSWVLLFEAVAEHSDIYKLVLSHGAVEPLRLHLQRLVQRLSVARMKALADHMTRPRVPIDILSAASTATLVGIVSWWLKNGRPHTPEEMALWAQQIVLLGPYYSLGMEPPVPTEKWRR